MIRRLVHESEYGCDKLAAVFRFVSFATYVVRMADRSIPLATFLVSECFNYAE